MGNLHVINDAIKVRIFDVIKNQTLEEYLRTLAVYQNSTRYSLYWVGDLVNGSLRLHFEMNSETTMKDQEEWEFLVILVVGVVMVVLIILDLMIQPLFFVVRV
ncbi:hypothetical protein Tco_1388486 [Tanacetum coccineum]